MRHKLPSQDKVGKYKSLVGNSDSSPVDILPPTLIVRLLPPRVTSTDGN